MPTFQGTPNNDVIAGGAGDDIIIGGRGSDQLTGGAGVDRFVFTGWQDSRTDAIDTITDFTTGVDRIDLTQMAGLRLARLLWDGSNTILLAATSTGLMRVNVTGRVEVIDIVTAQGVTVQGVQVNEFAPGMILNYIGPTAASWGRDYATGTSGADILTGSDVGSVFTTLWHDIIDGQGGDDRIVALHWDWAFGGDGVDTFTTNFPPSFQSNRPGGGISYPTGIPAILTGGAGGDLFIMAEEAARITDFTVSGPEADSFFIGQADTPIVSRSAEGARVGNWIFEGVEARDLLSRIFRADGSLYQYSASDIATLVSGSIRATANGTLYNGTTNRDLVDYYDAAGALRVTIGATRSTVAGTGGTDTLVSIETVFASRFNDVITGGSGNSGGPAIYGGDGDDQILMNDAAGALHGGAGNDVVQAGSNYAHLYGEDGDDRLTGNAYFDDFYGGAGADTMIGNGGPAGAQYDTAHYEDSNAGVTVDLTAGTGRGGHAEGDVLTDIGNVVGSAFGDVLTGTSGRNVLRGGDGDDVIRGGAGDDDIHGARGADLLFGGSGRDIFYLDNNAEVPVGNDVFGDFETGIDLVLGLDVTGAASLIRHGGSTYLFAQTAAGPLQLVFLNAVVNGSDIGLRGGITSSFFMQGSDSSEILIGSGGGDSIVGGLGDDIIAGGQGGDMLSGGAGADDFRYLSVFDSTNANYATNPRLDNLYDFETGIDTVTLSDLPVESVSIVRTDDGSSVVFAQCNDQYRNQIVTSAVGREINGADIRYGGTFGTYMIGSSRGETLVGSTRNDPLQGNGGNDTLIGGLGADVLFGGAGADVFQYRTAAESTANAAGSDTIFDMVSGVDKIDLRAVRTGASDAFGIAYLNGSSFLFVDLGGNGVNDMLIQLTNVTLLASDILWIAQALGEEATPKSSATDVLSPSGGFLPDPALGLGGDIHLGQDWYL